MIWRSNGLTIWESNISKVYWQSYDLIESITMHLLVTSPVSSYTDHEPSFHMLFVEMMGPI